MSQSQPNPAGWLWGLGAATLVVAARWREINLHGGEIPFLDQWLVEARQILRPWADGNLTLSTFFLPHHEHVPAWTRLFVWFEAVIFGRWDAQLQATINAVLMGGFTGLAAAWLRRFLPLVPALLLTALVVLIASLPHSWENIVWGFQAHMPLALLFVFAYQCGTFAHPPGKAKWWLAQAAGLAALFTLGSMWAAPLAVVLVLLWTADLNGKRLLPAGLLALSGVAILLLARAQMPATGAATHASKDLPQFLAAILRQLGWPSALPGAALLVNLPVLLLALRVRGKPQTEPLDRTVLALALWAAAQAAAFAFARGSYVGFVSRYADLLALGVLANGVALWRLLQSSPAWSRVLLILLTLGWGGVIGQGLRFINIQGHTLYFHEHSAQWTQVRRDAVRQYIATKDQNALASAEVRAVLFPDPAEVASVLDHPALAALLPASVRPDSATTPGNLPTDAARDLRQLWLEFAWCGGLLLLAGFVITWREGEPRRALCTAPASTEKTNAFLLTGLALGSGSLLFLWPQPFDFRVGDRWAQFLTPAGTVPDLDFRIVSESSYPKDRLIGGAALSPEDFRNNFFGTHVDGPSFTGVAESSAFPLTSPWYVAPFAGYPASAGNQLKLRIEDPAGKVLEEIICAEPNPGSDMTSIGFWNIDVRRHLGQRGRLILHDQRTAEEGWLAVAPPHSAADGAKVAAAHRRSWAVEGTLAGLHSLQVIGAILILLAAISLFPRTRRLLC